MRKISLLITMLIIAFLGFSQEKKVKFGIQGGINIANINAELTYARLGTSYTSKLPYNSITGFTGGVHAEIKLGKNFYLQPELSYSQMGAKTVSSSSDTTISGSKIEAKSILQYMVLPILLKYRFPNTVISIFAGPQYGYLLGVTNTINSTTINQQDNSNYKSDFAGVFGAEYYLPSGLGISARYQLGLSNIQKPEYVDLSNLPYGVVGKSISVRNTAFSFTVGYRF